MSLVTLIDAGFGYRRRRVIAGVSCSIDRGNCLGVYGPNGVGKSTLLRGMAGLIRPWSGRVTAGGGTRFGYVPQQRTSEAHWPMTALDAACLATSARGWLGRVGRGKQQVRARLSEMGLAELERDPFFQLSGGQQQRVLLAGALADRPEVLMLDEPTSGIDAQARALLLEQLSDAKRQGLAIVLVSHDPADLLALSDQILLLEPSPKAGEPSMARACDRETAVAHMTGRGAIGSTAAITATDGATGLPKEAL